MAMRIFLAMRINACVGYIRHLSDNAEVDADIRIRIAIPNWNRTSLVDFDLFTADKSFSWESGRLVGGH